MNNIILIKNGVYAGRLSTDMDFEEVKKLKEVGGAVCYLVSEAEYKKAKKEYDIIENAGVLTFVKGEKYLAKNNKEIEAKRAEKMPSVADQLDAIWEMLEPPVGSKAEVMKNKIAEIKSTIISIE